MYSSTHIDINVYRDTKHEYRWRAKSTNGRVIADSGEGYNNKADIIDAIMYVFGLSTIEAHGREFASEPNSYTTNRAVGTTMQTVRIEMTT